MKTQAVFTTTDTHLDRANSAWSRRVAAEWARRMMAGGSPGTWAENTENEVRFAVRYLGLRQGDRVLDLGCGWGRHSLPLAAHGLKVTGLDLSHDLLSVARYNARRHGLNVNWLEADVTHLPLHGQFDAVAQFCGNLLTWFSNREQALLALRRVAGLVRPGGRLLLGSQEWQPEFPRRSQHWDEWEGGAAIYRSRFDMQRRMVESQTVVFGPQHKREEFWHRTWWPTTDDMEALFAQVGLRVCLRTNGCDDAPYNPYGDGLVYVLARG